MNVEEIEITELAAKKVASYLDEEKSSTSKLWGCLSEILQESDQSVPTQGTSSDENIEASEPEVDQYLSAYLLNFKKGNPFRWWKNNDHCYTLSKNVARRYMYLSSPATSVHSEHLFYGDGKVYNYDDRRSWLLPELAESLLLIKYNF